MPGRQNTLLIAAIANMPSHALTSYFHDKKPYSAVTVQIERLTSEQFEPDDLSGIVDLIEVIRLQSSGPTEAARAIRKKLYVQGNISV